jgi:outer membrane protein assembly factor BamB
MDRGFMSCFDAASGEGLYVEQRLPRGSQFKASPVGADGHLYLASESGDVYVVRMGDTLELVATNTLADQFFVSSPVIADGRLYLRSQTHLFCIGASDEEG